MNTSVECLMHIEHLCNVHFGPQEVLLHDPYEPYEDDTPFVYRKIGDLSPAEVRVMLQMYTGTWQFCSDASLLRMLPAILQVWEELLKLCSGIDKMSDYSSQSDVDGSYDYVDIYTMLHQQQLLRRPLPSELMKLVTLFITKVLFRESARWSFRFRSEIPIGGANTFIQHFNSCAAILPSVEPLWREWWSMNHPSEVFQAVWFLQAICGGFTTPRPSVVDTRDLSNTFLGLRSEKATFWSDETRLFLQNVDWGKHWAAATTVINSDAEFRALGAWPTLSACAAHNGMVDTVFRERFGIYVEQMFLGHVEWRAWQEVESESGPSAQAE